MVAQRDEAERHRAASLAPRTAIRVAVPVEIVVVQDGLIESAHSVAGTISVPAAIGAAAKTPRPFSLSSRISRRSLEVGRILSRARVLRAAEAATPGASQL